MATKSSANGTSKQPTASEMREWYALNKSRLDNYAEANDALKQLRDVNKTTRYTTITNYSKEDVKDYIKNISTSESNLRNLSRYLFYRSEIYYRLCKYYANQIDTAIHSVIPEYSFTEENNVEDIKQVYGNTLKVLDEMNLQYEVLKAAIICMREDVFYGCSYKDEDGAMFWLPLNPDYCKINGVFEKDGSFSFEMDMSYFKRNASLLEFYGEPFESMYKAYESEGIKYQQMPEEYAVCLKFRAEDWETVVPPLAPIFLSLIDLMDMADYQAIQEAANVYKMLWMEMETIGDDVDDWKVNPNTSIKYFNRMLEEALPDYVTAAIVPGKLHEISFPDDASTDVTKVEKATKEILNTAGGAQILNLSSASNSVAFKYGVMADTEFIMSPLIPQIQAIVNRLLRFYESDNHAKVKFFEVGIYQKEEFRKSLLESAQYGLPTKLMVNALNGFSEKETMALNFLEENVLGVTSKFVPLQSSYTQSGNNQSGGQTKDDGELSDEGLKTRDGDKNNK